MFSVEGEEDEESGVSGEGGLGQFGTSDNLALPMLGGQFGTTV